MAESSGSAIATYGDGVKWLVGISAAALGGAFLHVKEINEQPLAVRVVIAIAVVAFLVSIWGGVNYLLWLNGMAASKERIRESTEKLQSETAEDKRNELHAKIEKQERRIAKAESTMPTWHRIYTIAFSAALLIATAGLCFAVIRAHDENKPGAPPSENSTEKKTPADPASLARFHIVYSAVHQTGHGREAHTFLMDDQTGAVWQMVCSGKDAVAFRLVERTGQSADAAGSPAAHPIASMMR
ncbi:MAG TPA: hypothetical protein VKX25_16210 [Bryobacteraceae bacterium]|jgi:hypothetical protein|nr:hypothetical protein [Bryobacteraceae bacterium]